MPIMMKRKDGTITPFRNAEYLSAYYFIPKRILEQCGKELNSIPRNPQKLIRDYNAVAVVESDLFIQLMMDAYAYMVWPYMCPGECMEVYSGYDPAWIFAHSPAYWVQEMLEENVIPPSSRLLRMNGDIDWVTETEVNDILLWLVPQTMAHYGMREVISIAEEYRCFEDFDFRAAIRKGISTASGTTRRLSIRRSLLTVSRMITPKNTTVWSGILKMSHRTSRTNPR